MLANCYTNFDRCCEKKIRHRQELKKKLQMFNKKKTSRMFQSPCPLPPQMLKKKQQKFQNALPPLPLGSRSLKSLGGGEIKLYGANLPFWV